MAPKLGHKFRPNRFAPPSTPTSIVLLIPGVFIVILLVLMRRSNRMQPKMDRSLELAEGSVKLAKEQIALQAETNRLLTRLIEAQDHR
jgi:hypothetical protein